ncbi:cyclin-F-like [Styela clava]
MEFTCKLDHQKNRNGIMDLPKDVQVMILQKLPYKDLIQLLKVSKYFENLIKNEAPGLLQNITLPDIFLNAENSKALAWLASKGNLEASIKLGFAHLYFDGLVDSARVRQQNSLIAAKYFCEMEQNSRLKLPITWVFIRPPWSAASVCRKAFVFKQLSKAVDDGNNHPNLLYCIGKVLQLFDDDLEKRQSAKQWFQRAADVGLPNAMHELWCMELEDIEGFSSIESFVSSRSPGLRLSLIRKLRKIAAAGYKPAQMQLCRLYAMGNYGGLPMEVALDYTKNIIQKSSLKQINQIPKYQENVTGSMRYILVDWLIEVATMKDFGSEMLHTTVRCVDRYLLLRQVSRSRLQLLGIACMVICTRYMERDVLTIREAVWLTDSTYKYNELVQMIEDVVATLNGNIKEMTMYDYLSIFLNSNTLDRKSQDIARFIADASLLHVDIVSLPPGISAAAAVFLANFTANPSNPWPSKLLKLSGYTLGELFPTAVEIHEKCLDKEPPTDFRNRKLDAVEERYSQCRYGPIKRTQLVTHEQLISYMQITCEYDSPECINTPCCSHSVTISSEVKLKEDHIDSTPESEKLDYFDLVMSTEEDEIESSEESDLETDTPPTLSSAYLMRTDTKTRKRITANRLAESKSAENLPATSSSKSKITKLLPKKRSMDKSKPCMTVNDKENRLSVPCANKISPYNANEAVYKEKSAKINGIKERTNNVKLSKSRSSRSPRMRM